MLDDHLKLRCREFVSASEGAPLNMPGAVSGKLVGQADRSVCRQRRAAARECCSDGSPQDSGIQRRMPGQDPEGRRGPSCGMRSHLRLLVRKVIASVLRWMRRRYENIKSPD